jgi:hypothetical protein
LHSKVAIAPGRHLPKTSESGSYLHAEAAKVGVEASIVIWGKTSRSNQAHLAFDDVPQLRKLFQAGFAGNRPIVRNFQHMQELAILGFALLAAVNDAAIGIAEWETLSGVCGSQTDWIAVDSTSEWNRMKQSATIVRIKE